MSNEKNNSKVPFKIYEELGSAFQIFPDQTVIQAPLNADGTIDHEAACLVDPDLLEEELVEELYRLGILKRRD